MVLRPTAYAACFLVVAAAGWVLIEIISVLALVLFPLVVTMFLTRILISPCMRLRARGWPPAVAAAATLIGFLVVLGAASAAIAPPMVAEFRELGDSLSTGIGEIEDWVVDDSGLDITRADIQSAKDDASDRLGRVLRDNEAQLLAGAQLVLTGLVGLVLSLVLTFFALKDGPRAQAWTRGALPEARREDADVVARAAWSSLGGYLRGAAMLGTVEAVIIGGAMFVMGTGLVLPVMLLTFLAAFVPLVGATVAGLIAVLVALSSGGLTDALVIGIVAVLVQQFDNDLLAPWIYGKSLEMHPVVILLAITTGTAAFGFVGTVLAVPLTAMVLSSIKGLREVRDLPPLSDEVEHGPDPPDVDPAAAGS